MTIFVITDKLSVVCQTIKTRSGFKHVATMIWRGCEREQEKCCYLNRTWERYTYESVLYKLLNSKKSSLDEDEKKIFKNKIDNWDW